MVPRHGRDVQDAQVGDAVVHRRAAHHESERREILLSQRTEVEDVESVPDPGRGHGEEKHEALHLVYAGASEECEHQHDRARQQ